MHLSCVDCGKDHPDELGRYRCLACGGLLEVRGEWSWAPEGTGVWRYATMLPPAGGARITLGEGGTPLLALPRLARRIGVASLHVKVEGQNPTGSFKDRGMCAGVTLAAARGSRLLLCASTGNTSASLAAYAARAGLAVAVLVPAGKIARGKMAQAIAFGARVVEVDGTFDAALASAEVLAGEPGSGVLLMNSLNPYRLEGQKTLAFEVLEQLRDDAWRVPDVVSYPYGNGGNVSAGWKGLREAWEHAPGLAQAGEPPRLLACEAKDRKETLATAIRIGEAVNASKAERAIRDSRGLRIAVSDESIVAAQRELAAEGIFVEPASAASIAGLRAAVAAGDVEPRARVVAVLTGNGLKDPDAVARFPSHVERSAADVESLRKVVFG